MDFSFLSLSPDGVSAWRDPCHGDGLPLRLAGPGTGPTEGCSHLPARPAGETGRVQERTGTWRVSVCVSDCVCVCVCE